MVTLDPQNAAGRTGHLRLVLILLLVAGIVLNALPLAAYVYQISLDGISPHVANRDFANLWMAAKLALAGDHLTLFSQPDYFQHLREYFGPDYPIHAWSYPPHLLPFLLPLGLMPYEQALLTYLGVTLMFFVASAWCFVRRFAERVDVTLLLLVLICFCMVQFDASQNGFLTGGLLLLGFAFLGRSIIIPSLAFAVLTVKPQLGLLIPVILAFDRNWRVLVLTGVSTLVLVALSVTMFGIESWAGFFTETVAYQEFVMTSWSGIFLPMMTSAFGAARVLGLPADVAFWVQLPFSLLGTALAILLLLRLESPLLRSYVVLCATMVISPYAFFYDTGALAVCAAVIATNSMQSRDPSWLPVSIGIVAVLPAYILKLGMAGIPVTPLILLGSLAWLLSRQPAMASGSRLSQA